ncbi:MAG: hypothetical protein AB7F96_10400 [Beijerinckiaceae bacterium]
MFSAIPKSLLLCVVAILCGTVASAQAQRVFSGDWQPNYPSTPPPGVGNGTFSVALADPPGKTLQLRALESMTIAVRKPSGAPVRNASISVAVRTREVDRRMQTAPRVGRDLGGGRYVIEGLRFDMAGLWLLEFEIAAGTERDKALLQVDVK